MHIRLISFVFSLVLCQTFWGMLEEAGAMQAYTSPEPLQRYLEAHLGAAERLMASDAAMLIREHAQETMEAVNTAPWREKLTQALVENYILPIRVTEEPLEPWRPVLRKAMVPLLQDVREPLEAALAIRRWMAHRVVPGQSQPWSLGPLGLLRAGAGRCEELGILFVCAARAAGLPARICYVPVWRDMDGNHLWVEVWNGAGWSALSVEQPDAPPDTGWFLPHADTAPVILARGFGAAPERMAAGDTLLRKERTGFVINRTAAYTTTGKLRISAVDTQGSPVPAFIQIHVFNNGRPRSASSASGAAETTMLLGTGTYLISAATDDRQAFSTATVRRGLLTEQRLVLSVHGDNTPPLLPQGEINQQEGFTSPDHRHAATVPGPPQRPLPEARADGEMHLTSTDRIYARPTELRREKEQARRAWVRVWDSRGKAQALRAFFTPYVLSGRVDREPFSHWRMALEKQLPDIAAEAQNDVYAAARRINTWTASLQRLSPQLSFPLPLETIIRRGVCGSEGDRAALAVAGLRTAGIPARLATLGDGFTKDWGAWVEFFDGKTWTPLYPAAPQLLGDYIATPAARSYYAPQMRIEFQTPAQTESPASGTSWDTFRSSMTQKAPVWGRDWTLCRISPQGTFVPVHDMALGALPSDPGTILLDLPKGHYVLVQGKRNGDGWITWTMGEIRKNSTK